MDITRWSTPKSDWFILIILYSCSQRRRSCIQSAKTRPEADCGSDHELLIAKFRLKLKKVGKTTISFRYDLNQIPYYYTVEVRNRFKGTGSDRQSAWWTMDRHSWHCTGNSTIQCYSFTLNCHMSLQKINKDNVCVYIHIATISDMNLSLFGFKVEGCLLNDDRKLHPIPKLI